MTAIHVVTSGNRNRYENHIREFHRLRHQVFVEECGWEGIRRADGLDIDSYDNANAVYLLAVDGERLVGDQRLYPTILPHMISEVFPHLATRGIPRAPYIWQWTR
ncbi:GNAT family N-acetyltransferase [Corallococcus exiguus]|uniref:acyl-homoserine-lactone synthase n=1 Tax=Corallococcus exiguus TaxID=83462 RepID=UPI0014766E24|nr:acyl-homoserine-lactone synthase [Corallococcus exiguus]NNC00864.1 GNAT family N-acetyltransferase [Corallococcus exiguus]